MKAEQVQGRIIHLSLDITLLPPVTDDPGDTDEAMDIGEGLVREFATLLRMAGEAEGFTVQIEAKRRVVY